MDNSGLSARRLVIAMPPLGRGDKDFVNTRPALSGEIQPKREFSSPMPAPLGRGSRPAATAARSRKAGEIDIESSPSIGDLVRLTAIPESEGQGDNLALIAIPVGMVRFRWRL